MRKRAINWADTDAGVCQHKYALLSASTALGVGILRAKPPSPRSIYERSEKASNQASQAIGATAPQPER